MDALGGHREYGAPTDVVGVESYAVAELVVADAAEFRGAVLAPESLKEAKRAGFRRG